MTRFLTVVASASALALVSVAAPGTAEARCVGCAVGAGIVGGIAAGALNAGATANRGYGYYDGAYAYEPAYGYGYGSGYAYEPGYAYSEPVYGGYNYGYRHRRAYSTGDPTQIDPPVAGT